MGWRGKRVPGTRRVLRSGDGRGPALLGCQGPLQPPSPPRTQVSSLALSIIRDLENSLLNASFRGNNLTLQTRSIQSLIFKLGCGFAGLSLNSTTMEEYSKVRGRGGGLGWGAGRA